MSSHFTVTNLGSTPLHMQAMSADKSGRLTFAYKVEVDPGKAKTFSSEVGSVFLAQETDAAPGVLLPRGVPPVDVEKPNDVPVSQAAAAEAAKVTDTETAST